jgi:hypothetical protein
MGLTVNYRSIRPVNKDEADAIRQAASAAGEGRTWLSCEPAHFFRSDPDGYLSGASKPNFLPHPDDVAAAAASCLPDGTVRDLLDVLCRLSREHGVDRALSHDHAPEIGHIRGGVCDEDALAQIEAIAGMCDILGELGLGDE